MKIHPGYMQHLVEDMQLAHVKDSKLSMFSIFLKIFWSYIHGQFTT